ncbi:MAG: hypothetical protein ACREFD_18980 [Stellaceae bacterium]
MAAARGAVVGFSVTILLIVAGGTALACGNALAFGGERAGRSFVRPVRGAMGLGFGFGQWWGPTESYAPPAYGYPPPVYAVPPPDASADVPPPVPRPKGCREFRSTVIVDGQARVSHGLACQQADGTWRIVQ